MKLYPPYLEGTIPAFYESEGTAELVVPFSMNKAVNGNQVHGMGIKIKTVQANSYIFDGFVEEGGNLLVDGLATGDTGKIEIDSSSSINNKLIIRFTNQFYKFEDKSLTRSQFEAYLRNYSVSNIRLVEKGSQTEVQQGDSYNPNGQYQIKKRRFEVGMFYKVQIAYSDSTSPTGLGYWSTVAVVKFTTKPDVTIEGLKLGKVNLHRRTYIGRYSQTSLGENSEALVYRDTTEKEYSYRFILTDEFDNILRDSGIQLHNNSTDLNNYESFDSYTVPLELAEGTSYYLQYIITTNNNMTIESAKYRLMYAKSVNPEIQAKVITKLNYNNGYIDIHLEGNKTDGVETNVTGSFLISRSDDKSNFTIWDEITRFNLVGQAPSSWSWKDMTVEHGVKYRYALQQYNENNLYSEKIVSVYLDDNNKEIDEPLEVYFEDAFLYDGFKQLKIKYNPKVSSFKTDLMEAKIDTIGSKYPFIFRNGAVEYKEFPISGLISYLSDEENLFLKDEELDLTKNFTNWKRGTTLDTNLIEGNEDYFYDLEVYSNLSYDEIQTMQQGYEDYVERREAIETAKQRTTDLLDYNMASERVFKLTVLDWLNNGKIKLFRSPAEGNYIVRLMNVSLTPEDRLGRLLHTFNCTAYEMAECTYENLMSYNLLNSTLRAGRVYNETSIELWKRFGYQGDSRYQEIVPGFAVIKPEINILPSHKEVIGLTFVDMPDSGMDYNVKIDDRKVLIKNNLPSYPVEMGLSFNSLEITDKLYNYMTSSIDEIFTYNWTPPLITVSYYEVSNSIFNTVTDIILDTVPARQWLGSTNHISQKYLNDKEISDLNKESNVNIIKVDSVAGLNYHQLVTYQTDNFVDMFNNNKENMLRFLYVHFYKREITDENNDNYDSFAWKLSGSNNLILHNDVTDIDINLCGDNTNLHLDQDVLYKFIFRKTDRMTQIPNTLRGTGSFPLTTGQKFKGDIIFYYDITHPYIIYYDNYYFIDQESLYTTVKTKTPLNSSDIKIFEDFNKRPYKLKFEPYSLRFSFNDGYDISLEYEAIKDRIRPTPFVAKSIVLGCGVGLNYAIETQTLAYHIEENNEVLHEYPQIKYNGVSTTTIKLQAKDCDGVENKYGTPPNPNDKIVNIPDYYFYQKYYGNKKYNKEGCLDIINENYSADINGGDTTIMDKIDNAYAALAKLYVDWPLDENNTSYCMIHRLKDKAIIQLDRQLAAWKEEELY